MHHAYFAVGEIEEGIRQALSYAEKELGLKADGNPDVSVFRYSLFSVEDARNVIAKAQLAPVGGERKVIVIAAGRIFHEAQNALLKLFEEPPPGTTLILIVPSAGNIIATLRSRIQPLPLGKGKKGSDESGETEEFINGSAAAREKIVKKILDDAKSDNDEKKQEARGRALRLAEALSRAGYGAWRESAKGDVELLLRDLDRLIPVLYDRAAPLKPILEHLLIVAPKHLT